MKIQEDYSGDPTTIAITSAQYIKNFVIRLEFADGKQTEVDFEDFLRNHKHPSVSKYLSTEKFKMFKIVDGNLDWNDFELCFPVFDLYNNTLLKNPSLIASS